MKRKAIVLASLIMFMTLPAFAGSHHQVVNNTFNTYINDDTDNQYGVKLDAPYLVKVYDGVFVGVEGGKDLNQTAADEGWFTYGKVTWTKNLLDFSKK